MYLLTGTADTKSKLFICDVIPHFCSLQELSNIVQDSSPGETPPTVQMKWLFCDVISLNSWWKRQEIYSSCRKDPVLDGGIHQTQLLLGNNLWYHSRFSYQCRKTEEDWKGYLHKNEMTPSVMWYIYTADEKGERFCVLVGVILYLTETYAASQN